MEKGWTCVYVSVNEYTISIARDMLLEAGIESVMINHKDSAYVFMGDIELFVREEFLNQASVILEPLNKG